MFHVAEGRTRAARAREACGVSETRVYRPVKRPRDEVEGALFTGCGHSSRLEGGALGVLRQLIDRQLYDLKCICRAIASATPTRVVSTALEYLAQPLGFTRSAQLLTYLMLKPFVLAIPVLRLFFIP